jgi:hypothetical protein
MIDKLRIKTSGTAQKAFVVLDAGIATEKNLIAAKGYDYLWWLGSKMKQYGKVNVFQSGNFLRSLPAPSEQIVWKGTIPSAR